MLTVDFDASTIERFEPPFVSTFRDRLRQFAEAFDASIYAAADLRTVFNWSTSFSRYLRELSITGTI